MSGNKGVPSVFPSASILIRRLLVGLALASTTLGAQAATVGLVPLGDLTQYLFVFTDGSVDANWQGATKGYVGDVAVNGLQADERTSGDVPYAGTIYTSAATLGAWQDIVDYNSGQASAVYNETTRLSNLETDFNNALTTGNGLAATTGYEGISAGALDGLNTQNNIAEFFVINVTSDFGGISDHLNITGDANDFFFLRWDEDGDPSNGYQGQVKFQSGGGINPLGNLTPTNFVNFAGDINASGGGTNPSGLEPYIDMIETIDNGDEVDGGGFFTGFWLTTGDPDSSFETSSLSNAIFAGGWYSSTTKFSMTSGTSGVYVPVPPAVWLFGSALGLLGWLRRTR